METQESTLTRKEMILRAATDLFREKGYGQASMRDIAGRLDIQASSLYAHIGGKGELLEAICRQMSDAFMAILDQIPAEVSGPSEKLALLIRRHLQIVIQDPAMSVVFFDEWRHLEEPFRERFVARRKAYEAYMGTLIREGVNKGDFRQVHVDLCSQMILSTLNWVPRWYRAERNIEAQRIIDETTTFIIQGLNQK